MTCPQRQHGTGWSELSADQQRYAIGWLSATAPDQLADAIASARTFDTPQEHPMTARTHSPAHRWFAWRPVDTTDRVRVWLRTVWRRRAYINLGTAPASPQFWTYTVQEPAGER